ncbi:MULTISPECIES: NADH:ubiquinone reductase (Na(+)-transporting) subunit F [unclassified Thioalkalivibrio]|uniref:NADH:ubiquinone reductase (Na(+)-transporting) subunit F n=1 Tax=unclassified Thioalkalivibrio TaxID=2621013 RepID=UPI00037B7557|nr:MULTISPECIES: 2Fe-2S iron-sulfur cluster binding domain-containing protein [unclassified Thioalkalivibrio]
MFGLFARKGPFKADIKPSGKALTVQPGDNLLKAALDNGIAWPHSCRVGSCGTCKARLVSGKIKPLVDFSYTLEEEDLDAGCILACQSLLKSDIEVEVDLESGELVLPEPGQVEGVIGGYRRLTHDIVEVGVRLNDPLPEYLAGQYAELVVPGVINEPRNYSFARAPETEESRSATFFVRYVPGGVMTTWLFGEDRTGSPVTLRGPFGTFFLRETDAPMLCVAGGSGLAPIKAVLEQEFSRPSRRKVTVLFGARTQEDLYCLDEMKAFESKGAGDFQFVPVLSLESEQSDWEGRRGNVTDTITEVISNLDGYEAYLCGPPPMVDAGISVLRRAGLEESKIHFDKFLDSSHKPRAGSEVA